MTRPLAVEVRIARDDAAPTDLVLDGLGEETIEGIDTKHGAAVGVAATVAVAAMATAATAGAAAP